MLSLSGDGLRYTTRNIIFLVTTAVTLGCLYGVYFDLDENIRNEGLYLSLFIVSTVFFTGLLILILVDSFTNRDLKIEREGDQQRAQEMSKYGNRFPKSSEEVPSKIIGKDKIYYNNAFEKVGNVWRTLMFAVFALFIFASFVITYLKHPSDKREEVGYIIAITVASLAMASHVGLLLYQLVEYFKLDKTPSISNVNNYYKNPVFREELENEDFGY